MAQKPFATTVVEIVTVVLHGAYMKITNEWMEAAGFITWFKVLKTKTEIVPSILLHCLYFGEPGVTPWASVVSDDLLVVWGTLFCSRYFFTWVTFQWYCIPLASTRTLFPVCFLSPVSTTHYHHFDLCFHACFFWSPHTPPFLFFFHYHSLWLHLQQWTLDVGAVCSWCIFQTTILLG